MSRLTERQMIALALDALEEAAAEAHQGPVRRTRMHRLTLAYLFSRTKDAPRWPFDQFWRDLVAQHDIGRTASLNASLNGIYLALKIERDHGKLGRFRSELSKP